MISDQGRSRLPLEFLTRPSAANMNVLAKGLPGPKYEAFAADLATRNRVGETLWSK